MSEFREDKLDTEKRPRISVLCQEFLLLVQHISQMNSPGQWDSLRSIARAALTKIETACKRVGIPFERFQQVKFALVAFLDETVVTLKWEHADEWKQNPLQMEMYGSTDSGEIFFRRLDDFRSDVRKNAEVLEVYYLVLVLGFRGKYSFLPSERLRDLISELYAELKEIYPHGVKRLAPDGYIGDSVAEVFEREIPVWSFAVFFGLLGCIVYWILYILV